MIYLDNAATSFHKPDCVPRAVVEAMQHAGNSGRGSSGEAMAASRLIFNTRCQIAEMFDVWGPECVAFTSNDTEALNIALQGTLHPEEELSMRSVRRWITTVCSVHCTAWKKRHEAYDPAGRPQGTDLPYGA